ncbi:MAG TPA: hypothetical protein VEJ20_05305, partial [Candidatus Eremiobacteraceae bacterium]|nr:hypothetical protein [Candidatus Eremiobacteraceae bacterium]
DPHPLEEFLDAGVVTTLNSDDPAFFGSSIEDEYALAARSGLDVESIVAIARNSVSASFLPPEEKKKLSAEVDAYYVGAGMTR